MFVIEMQVMNSDGNLEPIGLQIHNYYTANLLDPWSDVNRHTARGLQPLEQADHAGDGVAGPEFEDLAVC